MFIPRRVINIAIVFASCCSPVIVQLDIKGPAILHEPWSQPSPGGTALDISATVTDDVSVQAVTLFFRSAGRTSFEQVPMRAISPNTYLATIPAKNLAKPAVEYYIQAQDATGNTTSRGNKLPKPTLLYTSA